MAKLEIKVQLSVQVYPEEVAKLFWDMEGEEQAIFFNELAKLSGGNNLAFNQQLGYISEQESLTDEGRRIMKSIGEYAPPYTT